MKVRTTYLIKAVRWSNRRFVIREFDMESARDIEFREMKKSGQFYAMQKSECTRQTINH